MQTWIALFRGINVGGNNILPMKPLKEILSSLGCKNVRTYIQSGNVVLESPHAKPKPLAKKIGGGIQEQFGFAPSVLLLTQTELRLAIDANPFPDAIADPKTLHFFFLEQPPIAVKIELLEAAKSESETFHWTDQVFYLHAPDGISRSKLAKNLEKYLGVVTTARNFRTVDKLMTLATEG